MFSTASEQTRRFDTEIADFLLSAVDCAVKIWLLNFILLGLKPAKAPFKLVRRTGSP